MKSTLKKLLSFFLPVIILFVYLYFFFYNRVYLIAIMDSLGYDRDEEILNYISIIGLVILIFIELIYLYDKYAFNKDLSNKINKKDILEKKFNFSKYLIYFMIFGLIVLFVFFIMLLNDFAEAIFFIPFSLLGGIIFIFYYKEVFWTVSDDELKYYRKEKLKKIVKWNEVKKVVISSKRIKFINFQNQKIYQVEQFFIEDHKGFIDTIKKYVEIEDNKFF